MTPGQYLIRATAQLDDGRTFSTTSGPMTFLSSSMPASHVGNYQANDFYYSSADGTGSIYDGGGGTDTLHLDVSPSEVVSLDGLALDQYDPSPGSTINQAIYHGSAYDYVRLDDGREIYFQGIERLQFPDGTVKELQVHPNDPSFAQQWNLAVTDVPDAWRFTTGSPNVVLVSLDSSLPAAPNGLSDLSPTVNTTGINGPNNQPSYSPFRADSNNLLLDANSQPLFNISSNQKITLDFEGQRRGRERQPDHRDADRPDPVQL